MAKINLGRVILGGLLAGVVVNVLEFLLHEKVVKADETAAMVALGKAGTGQIWIWIVFGFAYGIALIWLYAALLPRFGAGAKTAAYAGLAGWFLSGLLTAVAMVNMGLLPTNVATTTTLWGLVESIVAAIAGAWLYREA
jgi:hypothetical protein